MRSLSPNLAAACLAALALSACDRAAPVANPTATVVPATADPVTAPVAPVPSATTSLPEADPTPPTVPDPAESDKGETGARGVLLTWARAIEFGRYGEAWRQWGDGGRRSGLGERAFAVQFAPYRRITIGFGEGQVEGAAGSLFYEVPVNFTSVRKDGATVRRDGTITLRRVNDVDGATPAQLRWHIERSTLRF